MSCLQLINCMHNSAERSVNCCEAMFQVTVGEGYGKIAKSQFAGSPVGAQWMRAWWRWPFMLLNCTCWAIRILSWSPHHWTLHMCLPSVPFLACLAGNITCKISFWCHFVCMMLFMQWTLCKMLCRGQGRRGTPEEVLCWAFRSSARYKQARNVVQLPRSSWGCISSIPRQQTYTMLCAYNHDMPLGGLCCGPQVHRCMSLKGMSMGFQRICREDLETCC